MAKRKPQTKLPLPPPDAPRPPVQAPAPDQVAESPAPEPELCRFQKFTTQRLHRRLLKNAPYNPRDHGAEAKSRLKANLKDVGLLEPVIWNEVTGNLVGGHMRLGQLDALEGKEDYLLDVAVVHLTEQEEQEQNVALNNPEMQGTYNLQKLGPLIKDGKLRIEKTGFDTAQVFRLLGAGPLIAQPEKLEEFAEKIRKAQESQERMAEGVADQNDPNFYIVLVFETRESREETLQTLGLSDDRFVDGRTLRERLGLYVAGLAAG